MQIRLSGVSSVAPVASESIPRSNGFKNKNWAEMCLIGASLR